MKCNARTSIFAWSSVAVAIIWSAGFSVLKSAISAFAKRFVGDFVQPNSDEVTYEHRGQDNVKQIRFQHIITYHVAAKSSAARERRRSRQGKVFIRFPFFFFNTTS